MRKAFTFIELLTVAAVLAILVSLLQPSLGRMVQLAERVDCSNNLRQLGVGVNLYSDSEGYFPVGIAGGAWVWPTLRSFLFNGV